MTTPQDWMRIARRVSDAWRAVQEVKCKTCALTRYEHQDHVHPWTDVEGGKCVFGDCGKFQG